MKKLSAPPITFSDALAVAISGIGNEQTRISHTDAFGGAAAFEATYSGAASVAGLYTLPRVTGNCDPVIVGGLRKSDLIKLYNQYFVPDTKPARRIYDFIKQIGGGKCPLCGGVGHVRTLDHYLPKSNFPLYSVLPVNLVPCCRDCNSDKLDSFAAIKGDQTIHPYFDNDRFFNEQWIFARVVPKSPPVIEFYVAPPTDWNFDDQSRAVSHFREYGLADKFSVEAAADLPETIQTRRTTMVANTPAEFSSYLAEKGRTATLPVNNWRRVMFSALAVDEWFCSQIDF